MAQFITVVGIDKIRNTVNYRVVLVNVEKGADGQFVYGYKAAIIQEQALINYFDKGYKFLNIKVNKSGSSVKVVGSSGSLDRFNNGKNNPYVAISEIYSGDDRLLGYRLLGYNGDAKTVRLKDMIAMGKRVKAAGGIPIQNLQFNDGYEDKKAFFSKYPDSTIIKEVIVQHENKHNVVGKVDTKENNKALQKLESVFTKEQIVQLKKGKSQGLNIKLYANPKLSAKQMEVLRLFLAKNVNIKPFADPAISVDALEVYLLDMQFGVDARRYMNPKYNVAQAREISVAYQNGIDISKFSDPSIKAEEMHQIASREIMKIWTSEKLAFDKKCKEIAIEKFGNIFE